MRHGWVQSRLPIRGLTRKQASGPITQICLAIQVSIPLIDGESGYDISGEPMVGAAFIMPASLILPTWLHPERGRDECCPYHRFSGSFCTILTATPTRLSPLQDHLPGQVWSCSQDQECGLVPPLKASSSHGPPRVSSCPFYRLPSRYLQRHHSRSQGLAPYRLPGPARPSLVLWSLPASL